MSQLETIKELFENQTLKSPESTALLYDNEHITYQSLNNRANQLAYYILQKQEAVVESRLDNIKEIVILFFPPSIELVVSLFAVIKSGMVYLPIDIDTPLERIRTIVEITSPVMVLTKRQYDEQIYQVCPTEKVICFDDLIIKSQSTDNPALTINKSCPIYTIFTSGSTGQPKGVIIKNESVVNYVKWMSTKIFYPDKMQIVDCSLSIAFDASVQVLIVPLCLGYTVSICPSKIKVDSIAYLKYLNEKKINITKIVPSYLHHLREVIQEKIIKLETLKAIIVGGEPFELSEAEAWFTLFPSLKFYHHYGPSETTVGVFCHEINFTRYKYHEKLPLGDICFNTQSYVLDSNMNPVSDNEKGLLYISGLCVAKGYINEDDLTKAKFIKKLPALKDIDAYVKNDTLYNTGDLVRRSSDGQLYYYGRNDRQIKIRGFRVELGDVELSIRQIAAITNCIVLKKKISGYDHLVAYYSVQKNRKVNNQEIKNMLRKTLPNYMIPTYYVQVNEFVTKNKKTNRHDLPEINLNNRFEYI